MRWLLVANAEPAWVGAARARGIEVVLCVTVEETLDQAQRAPVNLVVMDCEIERESPGACISRLSRTNSMRGRILVLLPDAGNVGEALENGADDVWAGPADVEGFLTRARVMEHRLREWLSAQEHLALADKLASMGTLAAGVAHQINNPLAWMVSGLDWISGELRDLSPLLPPERARELHTALGEVREGADRVGTIVRDLQTFSRGPEEDTGPLEVRPLLDGALKLTWDELHRRARVERDLSPVAKVRGNPVRLGQVFLNLLVNAAQAIPEGNAPGNLIRIRLFMAHDRVVFEVSDTGEGMSPEVQRRIFDPFFTTRPIGVGTGLGLSTCHGIVSAMGGQIRVESEVGRGSTFRVLLPAEG